MKNFFEIIGVLTLVIVSFTYNEEVAKVVKMSDSLSSEITARSDYYGQRKIESIVNKNTVIPGINGREVDINKSYNNMKQDGIFDESKLIYKEDKILNPLINHTDKYIISGNKSKRQVALIFKLDLNDDTNSIVEVLKTNESKATFFINSQFAKSKMADLKNIMADGHTVGNLSQDSDYIWLKTLITSMGNQNNNYCITEKENQNILDFCSKYKDYTVLSKSLVKESPFAWVKANLENGAILYLDVNNKLDFELSSIINYISNRGYKLVSLEHLLEE